MARTRRAFLQHPFLWSDSWKSTRGTDGRRATNSPSYPGDFHVPPREWEINDTPMHPLGGTTILWMGVLKGAVGVHLSGEVQVLTHYWNLLNWSESDKSWKKNWQKCADSSCLDCLDDSHWFSTGKKRHLPYPCWITNLAGKAETVFCQNTGNNGGRPHHFSQATTLSPWANTHCIRGSTEMDSSC